MVKFLARFLQGNDVVDKTIEFLVDMIQGLAQRKRPNDVLAVSIAIAGRNTRASNRENSRATFHPCG